MTGWAAQNNIPTSGWFHARIDVGLHRFGWPIRKAFATDQVLLSIGKGRPLGSPFGRTGSEGVEACGQPQWPGDG